jgi:hypothetical protein
METYRFYPPQLKSTQLPYHVISAGAATCEHELADNDWCNSIAVQDGVVFVTFSCKHCGRQVSQSLDEVLPPTNWISNNHQSRHLSLTTS